MSELSDFLMEHGILKSADAETMATEIEARFDRKRSKPGSEPCLECREVTLPMISVIGPSVPRGTSKARHFCSIRCFWQWIKRVEAARDEGSYMVQTYSWD